MDHGHDLIRVSRLKTEPEPPHRDYPIEWWFFQGSFASPSGRVHEFMLAFFRTDFALKAGPPAEGYSVLAALLDTASGKNHVLSRVDESTMEGLVGRLELAGDAGIDRDVARVLIKELKKHGPPRPVELGCGKVRVASGSLDISWDGLAIEQVDDAFSVAFRISEAGADISFVVVPEYPRILWGSAKDKVSGRSAMLYATYPRMILTGRMNGEEIGGTAWMDHQWGDSSWLSSESPQSRVQGWDWFGINLDDGTDMVASVVRDVRTETVLHSLAIVRSASGETLSLDEVSIEPLRHWESPLTHIKYPVECRILVPALEFDAVFEPLTDDQEIPVVGPVRSIWEGAGTVVGTMNGRRVRGRARGELHGYGYLFDFQQHVQTLADRVDRRIEEFLPRRFGEADVERFVGKPFWRHEPEAYTELLAVPSWDLISRSGKRWRPIFGILMVEALGCASENYEASACLAELVHSGALIIDDIEDGSLLRRGEPCIHLKYGVDVAINLGNMLYFLPSVELLNHRYLDDAKKLRIHEVMMQTYLESHFGQTVDIYWSKHLAPDTLDPWLEEPLEEKILQLYDYKTAAGARGLAEAAAIIAEADEDLREVCVDFSRAFGVAFQIIDDVHNFSDSPRWTKVRGEDIASGKLTYVIVRAIRRLEGVERARLMEILCSPELRAEPVILGEAVDLVRRSGALEECRETAKKMSLEANERFGDVVPSCEPKIMLSLLCLKMLDLAYDT